MVRPAHHDNVGGRAVQFLVTDLLGDFVYFPIWWESHGVARASKWAIDKFRRAIDQLGLAVWLKNLFVPMYGQYDLGGRVVSFLMRLFQIILRSFALLVLFVICVLLILAWIALPFFVAYMVVRSFVIFAS